MSKPARTGCRDHRYCPVPLGIVTALEEGFLRVAKCGGIDLRTVIGQRVTVHGKSDLSGVVASLPPHLKKESTDAPKIEELAIDCGVTADILKETVCVGDRVSFDCEPTELLNGRITGKSLDNRVGVAAAIEAAKQIIAKKADCTLILSLSAQEELGLRGARTATYTTKPDQAIVVDVSFGDGAGLSEKVTVTQTGCIGICQYEPVVEVYTKDAEKVTYVKMTAERANEVIEKHIKGGKPVTEYTIGALKK